MASPAIAFRALQSPRVAAAIRREPTPRIECRGAARGSGGGSWRPEADCGNRSLEAWALTGRILIFRLAVVLVGGVGTVAKLLGIAHPGWLGLALAFLMALAVALALASEVDTWRSRRPVRCATAQAIQEFMISWIGKEGRAAIYTRDMSWADDDRVAKILRTKAQRSELVICLPKSIPLTNELAKLGAEIHTYARLGYDPRSRFTVVRLGRSDAAVAIGRNINGVHTIETYDVGEHPVFALAEDLVEIARRADADL
jgi:hypothetical protein